MPECDLDDNDPLSEYLKRAPMIGMVKKKPTTAAVPVSSCICCLGMPLDNIYKFDSINSITAVSERRGNINHNEIDTENDKLEASAEGKEENNDDDDVSKQDRIESGIYFIL